jgi:hypothetical protein
MSKELKNYFLTKWTCPVHGYYTSRTPTKVTRMDCPDCPRSLFVNCGGPFQTTQAVPHLSKPRWPSRADATPNVSDKAPVRKRGKSW